MKSIFLIVLIGLLSILILPSKAQAATTEIKADADAYVDSANPNTNFGNAASIVAHYDQATAGAMRFLVHFDLSTIPANANITSAVMKLYIIGCNGTPNPGTGKIIYGYPTTNWKEATVKWSTKPGYVGFVSYAMACPGGWTWVDVDVTAKAQSWYADQAHNYGLIALGGEGGDSWSRWFMSREANPNFAPKIAVTYTLPGENEGGQAGGQAGAGDNGQAAGQSGSGSSSSTTSSNKSSPKLSSPSAGALISPSAVTGLGLVETATGATQLNKTPIWLVELICILFILLCLAYLLRKRLKEFWNKIRHKQAPAS